MWMSRLAALAAVLSLQGCAYFTTYKSDLGSPTTGVSVDIKQRMLLMNTKIGDADGKEWKRICVEPSPDALASLGASLGASHSTPVGSSSQLSAAINESAAYVGLRTQSIQLMRDAMYRACEAYMSGAIGNDDYLFLQRRFQAQVVGLLAIEQLTGAIASQPISVHTNASALTGGGANAEADRLVEAQKNLAQQQARLDELKAVHDEAQASFHALDQQSAPFKGKEESALSEAEKKALADTKLAQDELKKAHRDVNLQAHLVEVYQEAVEIAESDFKAAKGRTAASTSGYSTAPMRIASRPVSDRAVEKVADAVTNIVKTVFSGAFNDEGGRCLRKLYASTSDVEWSRLTPVCFSVAVQDYKAAVIEAKEDVKRKTGAAEVDDAAVQNDPRVQSTRAVRDALQSIVPKGAAVPGSSTPP